MQKAGKVIIAAVTAVIACMLLLFLTGLIPQNAIKASCTESAEYLLDKELFDEVIPGQFNTRWDNYADSILLNVMYHVSQEDLFSSLVRASYYSVETQEEHVNFYESLQEDKIPTVDYFRYWHGSMVLLRPLFVLTGVEGSRLILGMVLFFLIAGAAVMLWKRKAKALAVIYLIGNVIINVWMCLFCIEYVTTFLVSNTVLIVLLLLYERNKNKEELRTKVLQLMAVSGVVTCFVDFLTTETLTITIPLVCMMILLYEEGCLLSVKEEVIYLVKCGIVWGLSYAGMFLLKWLLAVMVLGGEAFGTAMAAAGERIGGAVYLGDTNLDPEANLLQRLTGLLFRNQGCLFPFRDTMDMGAAMWLFIGVCFLCFSVVYLFRPKKLTWNVICVCLILGAVPYLRYFALQNHAYIHYFFTYRAQLVTVIAILYCTWKFGLKQLFSSKKKK